MNKLIFKEDNDFSSDACKHAQKIYDEWVENQQVVYGSKGRMCWTRDPYQGDVLKARVVCEESLE